MEEKLTSPWEYCRFCAELININKLMKIDPNQFTEVFEKLNLFNLELYTENYEILLLKVCFVCWNNFRTAYEFCETFRKAQDRFREIKLKNHLDTVQTPEIDEAYCINDPRTDEYYPNNDEEDDNQPLINFQSKLHIKTNISPLESNQIEMISEKICEKKSWCDFPWLCKICRALLPDIESLREHSKTEHLLCPQFVCVDCGNYKYRSFNKFIFHIMTHRKYLKNVCIYCNKYSDTPRKHFKSHYSSPKEQCDTCGEVFDNKDLFEQHHLKYNPIFEQTASNDLNNAKKLVNNCIKNKFKEKQIVKIEPLSKECTNNNEFIAIDKDDENDFKSKKSHTNKKVSLKLNSKQNKNTKRKPYQSRRRLTSKELTCNECQKLFTNRSNLTHHRLKVHGIDDRPDLVCDQCAKIFKTEGGLKLHIENHDKKKPHQCKLCTKSFTQIAFLRTHVKLHLGIKPFECDQCQKRFSGRSFLNTHIKIAHGAEDSYSCQFCSKKFKTKNNAKRHELTHTGEKPFVCPECGMRFNNYPNCLRHSKRRHGVNFAKSKFTPAGPLPLDPRTGKVVELLDAATCPDWTKDLFSKENKRNKKKVK